LKKTLSWLDPALPVKLSKSGWTQPFYVGNPPFSYLKKLLISQQNIIFCNRLEHLWLKINKRHTVEKKKKKKRFENCFVLQFTMARMKYP
jgi:hypothetical protein